MIIDRSSEYYCNPQVWITSPVNCSYFYGNSSPPVKFAVSAGSQSLWSHSSDSGTGEAGESSLASTRQATKYQGVRVKNTVKELIQQRRGSGKSSSPSHGSKKMQQLPEGHCEELTSIIMGTKRPAASSHSSISCPKRQACLQNNIQVTVTNTILNGLQSPCSHHVRPPLSIATVQVQESPCPQEPSLYRPAFAPTDDLLLTPPTGSSSDRSIPPFGLQQGPPTGPMPMPVPGGVSFFQWQIRQEEEKLAGLTTEELVERDGDGDTFLHIAVAQGRRALSYVLARKMAAVGMLDVKEHNNQSALQVSVAANQHLIVQDLLTLGAQINTVDSWGRSPLHVCAEKGHALTLQAIHRAMQGRGLQLNVETVDHEGLTALHAAVLSHNAVLQELGQAASPQSPQKEALLQKRKLLGECISTLLLMGASYRTKDRKSGRTALHMAAEEANVELLRLFLDQPDSLSVINDRAYNGNSALHVASALQGKVAQVDTVKLLMRRGANPGAKNLENEQPAQLVPEGPLGDQVRRILKGKGALPHSGRFSHPDPRIA